MIYNELYFYLYVIIGVYVVWYMNVGCIWIVLFKFGFYDKKGGKVKSFSKGICKKCLVKLLIEIF